MLLINADDFDANDSIGDELNTAKLLLMANLSHYAMPSSEQSNVVNHLETEITSDSNIIPYSQYLIESQQVLSIRKQDSDRSSLEMCMCLKDHLDATDRIEHTLNLENSLDFEEEILDEEVLENEAIALSIVDRT
ncbi:hypothetical protein Tco_0922256 [Tanacetum coccineum]|uniref:Uncharacterized protein n=1 Tax=Tanacetum coccineum TaxID=301880 RepID=A0ABQ5CZ94_9ASTR